MQEQEARGPAGRLGKLHGNGRSVLLGFWLLLAGLMVEPWPVFANQVFGPPVDPSALCQAAISFAEQTQALPSGMLHSIGIVESGRPDAVTGRSEPWPWTIDANGAGHVYATEQDAIAAARAFEAAGVTSLDVGCLQVNLQQHPDAFATLDHAFAPAENALYAARFVRQLKTQLGSWNAAIAGYHSQTPALGLPYEQRVLAVWQSNGGPQIALGAAPAMPLPEAKPVLDASGKADLPKQPASQLPANHPAALFAAGGFQFMALHQRAAMPPMAALPQGSAGLASAGAVPLHGLSAYRAAPILIASVR